MKGEDQDSGFAVLGSKIAPSVLQYFKPWIYACENQLRFCYGLDGQVVDREIFSSQGSIIPTTSGIWLAGTGYPATARHLFVFYSAIEALSFFCFHSPWLKRPGNVAVAACGLYPSKSQLRYLQTKFRYGSTHAVFGRDLPARVMDCKVALWSKGLDVNFSFENNMVRWMDNGKLFQVSEAEFSLHRFQRLNGLRLGIRTHKPLGGYASYLHFLQNHS